MEFRILTPQNSSEIVEHLMKQRGWTLTKLAKTTNTTPDFIRRVRAAKQSFEERDVAALAKACRQKSHRLIFDSIQVDKLNDEQRGLYELTRQALMSGDAFTRVITRKPAKKRRVRTRAA